ncbi:SDR family oxidoreductase [Pseudonocardia sp. C8]|uniref:SDR family NAD(P)-dependent oxidoreductase n=1 Tax=Pseudonocardia sp. C8 TaxID=2762759 RepID=UPI0016432AF5|nr:SDR family oxidoreductase [Pseudonocardia sp. C8]MBC3191085.1 SDR family oxidoreductase [Pseudonocardia sp. C8]
MTRDAGSPRSRGVLVTGAARGIGRAIATAFAGNGDRVALHYASRDVDAESTRAGLRGDGHTLIRADLSDSGQVAHLVDTAEHDLGGIDVVVNNAAIMLPSSIDDCSYDDWQQAWQQTFAVNVFAAANVSYCAARHMIAGQRAGRIVNVSSRGAFRGEPHHPAYGASKAALNALGQSLALALGKHGISVTTVAPGFVETERVAGRLDGPEGKGIRDQSPLGRVAQPAEIASAVLYLASPHAEWTTGAILDVNGASHLRT